MKQDQLFDDVLPERNDDFVTDNDDTLTGGWLEFCKARGRILHGQYDSRSALATDERRAMVRRDGVSVFESDIYSVG